MSKEFKKNLTKNILGSIRAEADREMLSKAFYYNAPFEALTSNNDFNFVIGRRGTGKSALFLKCSEKLKENKKNLIITEFPEESSALAFKAALRTNGCSSYNEGRAISILVWQVFISVKILENLSTHYKFDKLAESDFLINWQKEHFIIMKNANLYQILDQATRKDKEHSIELLPQTIATFYNVKELLSSIDTTLASCGLNAYVMFDGLDEGWLPDPISTSVLGGLAYVASKLKDKFKQIHLIAFVRDNMFRALNEFDPDSSRNIEGEVLRLVWTEESLYELTVMRIKESLNLHSENSTKAWDRLFVKELKGREGFKQILKSTLYRPRDVLVLINSAFGIAMQAGRERIIEEDIESTAVQVSRDRYRDLHKEYDVVLPGLEEFCEIFRGGSTNYEYKDIIEKIKQKQDGFYTKVTKTGDFGLFDKPDEVFQSLFSVGFIGKFELKTQTYLFCHDGSQSNVKDFLLNDKILIHPCYWRALALDSESQNAEIDIIPTINDEYGEVAGDKSILERRHALIGKIYGELSQIPTGASAAKVFEDWVYRTIKLLTQPHLSNVELHPNGNAIHRRDIVATNEADSGFWKRLFSDYSARHIIFEVKNYEELSIGDYRQIASYLNRQYGSIGFIVNRSENENISKKEAGWTKEIYHEQNKLIIVLSDSFLKRSLSKLRGLKKESYFEEKIKKKLDEYERKHISIKHTK